MNENIEDNNTNNEDNYIPALTSNILDNENDDVNDHNNNILEYHNFAMVCPLCNDVVEMTDFHQHMLLFHTTTYLTMFATHFPSLSEDQIWDLMTAVNTSTITASVEDILESDSYENLLQLCDDIGYHYIGVSDDVIDTVAPQTEWKCAIQHNNQTKCPICLDDFVQDAICRTLKECGHIYCCDCIQTWFKEHKSCPICKKDVMASYTDSNQIASISISDSASSAFLLPPLEGLDLAPDPPDVPDPESDSECDEAPDDPCLSSINTT